MLDDRDLQISWPHCETLGGAKREMALTLILLFRQVIHPVFVLRFTSLVFGVCRETATIMFGDGSDGNAMRLIDIPYGVPTSLYTGRPGITYPGGCGIVGAG